MHRVILGLIISLFFSSIVHSTCQALPAGLTLSPIRNELSLAPGTAHSDNLTVTNDSDAPIQVQMAAEAFSIMNDQYDYSFDASSGLAKWISFQQLVVDVPAHEKRNVPYVIGVPLDAEPGGRYISIFASTGETSDGSKVSIRQRVASLLYITVEGDVTRKGEVLSISAPSITLSGVEQISFQLRNSGSTHYRSKYELKVASLFGGTEQSVDGDALILPGSVRRITEQVSMPFWPGVYKIQMRIGLGDNPLYSEERMVIYIPAWFIVAITVGIGGVYIYRRTRKIKSSAERQYTK